MDVVDGNALIEFGTRLSEVLGFGFADISGCACDEDNALIELHRKRA